MVLNFHNIKQMLQNNELSWASLESTLKESHTDDETIKKVQSLFNMIDANRSQTISLQEWENVYGILNNMDSDGNGEISDEEFNNAQEDNMFKQFGNEALNTFLNTAVQMDKNASNPLAASISGGGGNSSLLEYDSEGNLITYPLEGESFKKTAERLGFKPGTPEYAEFVNANPQAGKRNWFKVGDQVKIPKSIQDKVNQAGIVNKETGYSQVDIYNTKYRQMNAETSDSAKPVITAQSAYPAGLQSKIDMLKQQGSEYEVIKTQEGYTLNITSGQYLTQHNIGLIEIKYNAAGKMLTYTQKYNNGKIVETSYKNGQKTSKVKANPAPKACLDVMNQMKKRSGGNARIEKLKDGNYVIIQTNTKDKNVKEIRTVIKEKSWQDETSKGQALLDGVKDGWNAISLSTITNPVKIWNAAVRNRNSSATSEDHYVSQTTTYKDGKVVESAFEKGKLTKNNTVKEASTSQAAPADGAGAVNLAETVKNRTKLNTATDISFSMPADAPENAQEFADALINNKEKLMRELGIDSDTYNMLAQTAIGIAKQETNFGESTGRQKFKDIARAGSDTIALVQDSLGIENKSYIRDWSYGMTQLKYTLHTQDEWVKTRMHNMGITNELQLEEPEQSAIATMIVLAKLNKEIDAPAYQAGIKTAQGINVEYEGWELNEETGIAEKTGNTKAWTNNITRQDVLCAFWNGGARASVKNGTFKPQGWAYSRNVSKYTQEYKLVESQSSRAQAVTQEEETRVFKDMDNNGEMGGVVFLPAMYTDKQKHMNTSAEIKNLDAALTRKGIDTALKNQLISALTNGELGFDFGLKQSEIESLTNADIKLLLLHLNKLKSTVNSDSAINTSDGISTTEAAKLRTNYANTVADAEDEFRAEYLNKHSAVYNASDTNPKVLRSFSTVSGSGNYASANGRRQGFKHETPRGVNINTTDGTIRDVDYALANAAYNVVQSNPNNSSSGKCLNGIKTALKNCGIDTDEADETGMKMTDYGNTPKMVYKWFLNNPEKFTQIEYVSNGDGTARKINASDIAHLPAGCIVMWIPGEGYSDQAGHAVITNGYGQGYADATDNLGWGSYNTGKGEHGHFVVFKLASLNV